MKLLSLLLLLPIFFQIVTLNIKIAKAHSGGLNSQGCHGGKKPYHCHRSQSEMVGNRLKCDLGSRSKDCKKKDPQENILKKNPYKEETITTKKPTIIDAPKKNEFWKCNNYSEQNINFIQYIFKVEDLIYEKNLYLRTNGRWKNFCPYGGFTNEKSFICNLPRNDTNSHFIFDLITKELTFFRNKEIKKYNITSPTKYFCSKMPN